jgi:hypothetical protein
MAAKSTRFEKAVRTALQRLTVRVDVPIHAIMMNRNGSGHNVRCPDGGVREESQTIIVDRFRPHERRNVPQPWNAQTINSA